MDGLSLSAGLATMNEQVGGGCVTTVQGLLASRSDVTTPSSLAGHPLHLVSSNPHVTDPWRSGGGYPWRSGLVQVVTQANHPYWSHPCVTSAIDVTDVTVPHRTYDSIHDLPGYSLQSHSSPCFRIVLDEIDPIAVEFVIVLINENSNCNVYMSLSAKVHNALVNNL